MFLFIFVGLFLFSKTLHVVSVRARNATQCLAGFVVKITPGSRSYFYCICPVTVCDTTLKGDGTVVVRVRLNDLVRIL